MGILSAASPLQRHNYNNYTYNIFHRYSEEVIGVLGTNKGLPARGSAEYYSVQAASDQRRHRLKDSPAAITFAGGDVTEMIENLANLQYALVYVGTPPVPFLVALDTGSATFSLPCGCNDCARSFQKSDGEQINLYSYNYSTSRTSEVVPCGSPYCFPPRREDCPLRAPNTYPCPYEVVYMAKNTSTRGILVKDVMHLETYDDNRTRSSAPVIFGCGQVETGDLLGEGPVNGLLGLGYGALDVTSLLSSQGLVRNSFSMCFAPNGYGRFAFGDLGDLDQMSTPFLPTFDQSPYYNIQIEHISVENVVVNLSLVAFFDSGTTLTHLAGEAYSLVTKTFNLFVNDTLVPMAGPFEYCYISRTDNGTSIQTPSLSLRTKGGADFHVLTTTKLIKPQPFSGLGEQIYCLGIIKNDINNLNIIGRNFMTGYRVVFDREKLILGWKSSYCK
ncbi:hypothetical protein DM860_003626 [Cuscuta australis]|uniref:Peptidase A1 domain-containing protein n=1 Tax=Cuscuta australis TaxID=267555 RepID=A0A328DGL9_9ASTE|nr:hypothetical protein DM860_003626 [Cuscuta australis]